MVNASTQDIISQEMQTDLIIDPIIGEIASLRSSFEV
jgi:hypothetical protein